MSIKTNPSSTQRLFGRLAIVCLIGMVSFVVCGCQDGPMYALKVANPYYSMREWKEDEAIGVTDHQRRTQLAKLAETIGRMPAERQAFWAGHLDKMIENDDSPEMRRLAVRAAGQIDDMIAIELIEKGLDDDSVKVRMEACRSLGGREGDEVTRMLASTVGTETNQDVKHAALIALSTQKNDISVESLKLALSDRNPATRSLAVKSLKGATGKNYGDDPDVWIAALNGKPAEEQPTRIAERLRSFF